MKEPYKRSPELEALKAQGITKWSELEKHGVKRCCAYLYNSHTKKSRRCRREAGPGGFCAKHQPAMDAAEEMNRQAIEADKKSNEEWSRRMRGQEQEGGEE